MQTATFTSLSSAVSPDELRDLIESSFKSGDKIHVSKKSRKKLHEAPAVFKGIYNHFIRLEAPLNEMYNTIYTISLSDLYTGDTVIHELLDLIKEEETEEE